MSYTYQSPAEAAAEIRGKLKKLYGITSRQVSVRCASFSMGSSIDIEIKDPAVDIREVRNAADSKEKIDRCQYTGEILSGGNRYLSVKYGSKAAETFAAANVETFARLLSDLPPVGSTTGGPEVVIDGKTLVVFRLNGGRDLIVRDCSEGASATRPAYLPPEDLLDKPLGKRDVAAAILSMRGGDK
jgi:copper chaperone CopZ